MPDTMAALVADPTAVALLNGLTWALAWAIFLSGIDDLLIDALYWGRQLLRRLRWLPRPTPLDLASLRETPQRPIAVLVPAWHEAEVIASMAANTLRTLDYANYVVFIGTYRNDPATTAQVEAMVRADPLRVVRARVDRDGPTCKADCLNWILREVAEYERHHGMQFVGTVMHDCEDVVHPLELLYCNRHLAQADLIQLPVMSLELPWHSWVGGCYLDDFAEMHQKDLPVRQWLTNTVPGAGVALCYSRRALAAMSVQHHGQPFNTDSLTEDYDFSFRLAQLPAMRQLFADQPVDGAQAATQGIWRRPATASGLLATCEYFPSQFRAAYRQRTRWTIGIALLGWRQLGWHGGGWTRWMFMRDRKGLFTAPASMLAYGLLGAVTALATLQPQWAPRLALLQTPIQPLLWCNLALLGNRMVQRSFFVTRACGMQQGLLALPRMIVNNFINFFAVSRAWQQWLRHLWSGVPILWDKTQHTFPTHAALSQHRRLLGQLLRDKGVLSEAGLDAALVQHRASGTRLGKVLIDQGHVTPEVLADAVAEQQQLPRAQRNTQPMRQVSGRMSQLIRAHQVVPVAVSADNTLHVAVAVAPAPEVTRAIRAASGMQVAYVVACDHEVERWVAELSPPHLLDDSKA